jgi:hypothetical protein
LILLTVWPRSGGRPSQGVVRYRTSRRGLPFMVRLLWALSVRTRYFLRRYTPTNVLIDAIRTRRGLKWGIPAMLLAVPYLLAASLCVNTIENGGPGWLNHCDDRGMSQGNLLRILNVHKVVPLYNE